MWPKVSVKEVLLAFVIVAVIWSFADTETAGDRAAIAYGSAIVLAGVFVLKGLRARRQK
jgi:hypothetical protein